MDFRYALKVEQIELQEELLWDSTRAFLEDLWSEIKYHLKLGEVKEVKWNLYRFLERVDEEIQKKNWDLRKFRNSKNEPVTNLFKKIIREIAKESKIEISNDILSRLLNYVRNQYSTEGVLVGVIFPVEAFVKRKEYNLPFDLGDENSCFRQGGSNEGSAIWLQREDEIFDRAKLVVFHYKSKSGNKEGIGRCWVYKVSKGAIFATNFYSRGVDIRSRILKYSVVKLLRLLFGLSEDVRFVFDKDIDLPIYLNGDGLIIYEKSKYSESDEVVEWATQIQSQCMICKETTKISELYRYEKEMLYDGREVSGLIMCKECLSFYEDVEMCAECGNFYHRDELLYYEDCYWCEDCFNERFTQCYICKEYCLKDEMIIDKEGNWLCLDCASNHRIACIVCGKWFRSDEATEYTNPESKTIYVCKDCEAKLEKMRCENCNKEFYYVLWDYKLNLMLRELVKLALCHECYKKRLKEMWDKTFNNPRQLHLPFDFFDLIMIEP